MHAANTITLRGGCSRGLSKRISVHLSPSSLLFDRDYPLLHEQFRSCLGGGGWVNRTTCAKERGGNVKSTAGKKVNERSDRGLEGGARVCLSKSSGGCMTKKLFSLKGENTAIDTSRSITYPRLRSGVLPEALRAAPVILRTRRHQNATQPGAEQSDRVRGFTPA